MIHSLAGGVIRDEKFFDFAKVELLEGLNCGNAFWFLFDIPLSVGDVVIVNFAQDYVKGKVVRIDYDVSEKCCPVSPKRAKKVLKKCEN